MITANNTVNLFGASLGLVAKLGNSFLVLTWTGLVMALLANWYVLAVWFFQFRTVNVTLQQKPNPILHETSEDSIWRPSARGRSRLSRNGRVSKYADF